MEPKKTDPYALFLLVAAVLLVVGAIFTHRQYKEMDTARKRLAQATKWWTDSLAAEKKIAAFPQKEVATATAWTMQDVNDAIVGSDNPRVRAMFERMTLTREGQPPEPLKDKYHLDLNFVQARNGSVMEAWDYTTQPLKINQARLDDLGMFVAVIEFLFPQAKTTLINYAKSPDKSEGNGTVELSIYTEKEK